jgi:hypothetical protein
MRWLIVVFAVEAGLGFILLVLTGNWISLLVIAFIMGLLGGLSYVLAQAGFGNARWNSENFTNFAKWKTTGVNAMNASIPGIKFNLGGFEHTEPINLKFEKNSQLTTIQLDVQVGTLRVTAQPGLETIQVTGLKRVWVREPSQVRYELDNLQVGGQQENNILKIYAGTRDKINIAIGQVNRVDLEVLVPDNLAGVYTTQSGDIIIRGSQANTTVRSNTGSFIIENFGSGHNLTANTNSGNISLQQIAAGQVQATTNLGRIELTGGGAELFNLESSAGNIRARGVNCGQYRAKTQAGGLEVYDLEAESPLDLHTSLGRIHAANVKAPSFNLGTHAGSVFYQGNAPTLNSEANSNMGSVHLRLSPGASFNLQATSNLGAVSIGMQPAAVLNQTRNAFRGTFGAGGPIILANSNLGSVQVGH